MDINQIKSSLRMDNLYFKEYSFNRKNKIMDGEYKISIQKSIRKTGDHTYNIEMQTNVDKEDMNLQLIAAAEFIYEAEDYSKEESIVNSNTVAIMFPFIRSQITLMTSQPGMVPIILPPIDTSKL